MKIAEERGKLTLFWQELYSIAKFAVEWTFSLTMLTLSLPILIAAAVLTKVTSSGPVFYCQTRLGKNGRHFRVIKLRTMTHDCEAQTGPVWAMQDDPRVTPVGRFLRDTHLDEIPQFWNVLRGEMSLIGPRPERPEIASQLQCLIPAYGHRLEVRPGITGLAQLRLPADRSVKSVRRKLCYDLYYVRHVGLLLDARVLGSTCLYVAARVFRSLSEILIRSDARRADVEHRLANEPPFVIGKVGLELRLADAPSVKGVKQAA